MNFRIFYGLLLLLAVFTGTAFAQEPLISIQTDKKKYTDQDVIVISGKVTTILKGTPILLQLFTENNLNDIAQITPANDGNYNYKIHAKGNLFKKQADYIVKVSYGQENIAETEFSFIPKLEMREIRDNFEVNAGGKGTFDVAYTINGGTMKNIEIDQEILGLIVRINATDKGQITLDLNEEYVGAKKQDGTNEQFIVLIDDNQVFHRQSPMNPDIQKVTVEFEPGDSEIKIIGTYVIPEFSSAVMATILIMGVVTTILVTGRLRYNF